MVDKLEIPISIKSTVSADLQEVTKALLATSKVASSKAKSISLAFRNIKIPVQDTAKGIRALSKAVNSVSVTTKLTSLKVTLESIGEAATKVHNPLKEVRTLLGTFNTGTKVSAVGSDLDRVLTSSVALTKSIKELRAAIKGLGKGHKLGTFTAQLDTLDIQVKDISASMLAFNAVTNSAATSLGKIKGTSLSALGAASKKLGATAKEASSAVKGLSSSMESMSKKGGKASASLKKVSAAAANVKVSAAITANSVKGLSASVGKLSSNERLNSLERGFKEGGVAAIGFKEQVDQVGFSLFKTQQALTIIASLSGAAFAVVKALEFGRAMGEVNTLLSGGAEEAAQYADIVSELSSTFGQDLTSSAKAMYQAISLGASDAASAQGLLGTAMKSAKAGVSDVETTTKLLASTINSFGMSMLSAGLVSDSFFTAVKGGGTTLTELSASFAQVAPIAAAAGVSLEEVNAAIADITIGGTKTPEAITQLKGVISGLIRPSTELNKIFHDFGGNAQAAIKTRGLAFAIEKVSEASKGNVGALKVLVGTDEALLATLALTRNGMKGFTAALEDQTNKAGATDKAFGKISDTLASRFDVAANSVGVSFAKIGDLVLRTVVPALEILSHIMEGVTTVFTAMPRLVDALVISFAALGVALAYMVGKGLLAAMSTGLVAITAKLLVANPALAAMVVRFGGVAAGAATASGFLATLALTLRTVAAAGLTLLANPVGLAIAAITVALLALGSAFDWGTKIGSWFDNYNSAANKTARAQEELTKKVASHFSQHKDLLSKDKDVVRAHNVFLLRSTAQNAEVYLKLAKARIAASSAAVALAAVRDSISLKRVTLALSRLVSSYGAAALSAGDFTKRVHELSKVEIDSTYAKNAAAITSFSKSIKGAAVDGLAAFKDFNNKSVSSMANASVRLNSHMQAFSKRFTHIVSKYRTDGKALKSAAQDNYSALRAELGKNIALEQSLLNQAVTQYKGFLKEKEGLAKASADYLASIQDNYQVQDTASEKRGKERAYNKEAIADARTLRGLLSTINDTGASSDDKAAAYKKAKDLLKVNSELYAKLAQDNPAFARKSKYQAKQFVALAKAVEAAGKPLNMARVIEGEQSALEKIASVEERLASLYKIKDRVIKIQIVVAGLEDTNIGGLITQIEKAALIAKSVEGVTIPIIAELKAIEGVDTAVKVEQSKIKNALGESIVVPVVVDNGTLKDALQPLADAAPIVPVKVAYDPASTLTLYEKVLNKVQSLNKSHPIILEAIVKAKNAISGGYKSAPTFAEGGQVTGAGTGTSDSIPAMLSNGEFVMTAAAVRQYGTNFMDMINTMSAPRPAFAAGGIVSAPSFRSPSIKKFAAGGLVSSAQRDSVDLNITLGGGRFAVQGDRDQVDGLVNALKMLQQEGV